MLKTFTQADKMQRCECVKRTALEALGLPNLPRAEKGAEFERPMPSEVLLSRV